MGNTALVVDDEPKVLDTSRRILESKRYMVYVAEDGNSGFDLIKRYRPQLIVTDVDMPGMNGIDMLRGVEEIENYKPRKVVIISGKPNEEAFSYASELGYEFFVKPDHLQCLFSLTPPEE